MKNDNDIETCEKCTNDNISIREFLECRLIALEKATTVAAYGLDRRLEGMNEFRDQLRDQTSTFITRNEHDIVIQRLGDDIKYMREQFGNLFSRKEYEVSMANVSSDIRILRESKATLDGKASQLSANIALTISVIGIMLSLFGVVHNFYPLGKNDGTQPVAVYTLPAKP